MELPGCWVSTLKALHVKVRVNTYLINYSSVSFLFIIFVSNFFMESILKTCSKACNANFKSYLPVPEVKIQGGGGGGGGGGFSPVQDRNFCVNFLSRQT